jgi:uncharacterized protein (DUF885 family)
MASADVAETPVYQLSDRYVEEACALDPVRATFSGVIGHDDRLTDYSPDGWAERTDHDRATLAALDALDPSGDLDRIAARVLRERLELGVAMHDAGEDARAVRNIGSPVQSIRQVFDVMPKGSASDWEVISRRLAAVPDAVDRLIVGLRDGMARGLVAARRQAREASEQCRVWAGERDAPPFFTALVAEAGDVEGTSSLRAGLDDGADVATIAYGRLGDFLDAEYAPAAGERDAVGRDRYTFFARTWLGADIDLDDTYRWGWDELFRIEDDLRRVADQIVPGASIDEAIDHLETAPDLAIEGVDTLQRWLQDLMDRTVDELDGTHFDIPAPIRRVEAMIAPPGTAAAMYYTAPSEDLSRPGRTWYPTLGKTRFPRWGEVSIAYHEGVPGHHLQLGQVKYRRDLLSRFQRSTSVAGHAEGWALYAERLMDELGFLDEPMYRLGMLRAQAMRAVRVIVDIGMHLELAIPDGQDFHPGETWTPELGQEFVDARSRFPSDFMASEIVRYLGWPGQAICYKVGERVWLGSRAAAQERLGDAFDLKAWHAHALDLGPMGLDQLAEELAVVSS